MSVRSNWLDRAVSFMSPERGMKRTRARLLQNVYQRAMEKRGYDGASSKRRLSTWGTSSKSINAENRSALGKLRSRSRDLVQNEPFAKNAIRILANNIVGAGIIPKFSHKETQQLWKSWGEQIKCSADERMNFYTVEWLIAHSIAESGEIFVRRRRRPASWKLQVPLQIEVLEADFIDTQKGARLDGGGFIIQGVEFDRWGRRAAYWLFDEHPGEGSFGNWKTMNSKRVPADEIHHIFESLRPGQVRGIPWLSSCIVRLHDYSDFMDATLLRQKIAACFTAFIQRMEGPEGEEACPKDSTIDKLEPGAVEHLGPGETISFPQVPNAASFVEVSPAMLASVAAGLGITYEELTCDYSRVNFSSGRLGWARMGKNLDAWRWHMLIPLFCNPVADWFIESAIASGKMSNEPEMANRLWTPPRREMIDPTREIPAQISAIRAGTTTLAAVLRESGEDPKEVLAEIAEYNEEIDRLGLVLDSDGRKMMKAGILQPEQEADKIKEAA